MNYYQFNDKYEYVFCFNKYLILQLLFDKM